MSKLTKEYLKRENTFIGMINGLLPDPDKILIDNGLTVEQYTELLVDPHLTATILQRKMQVIQMGWEVFCEDEKLRQEGIEIMENLPMNNYVSQVLDAVLYGFNVGEIIWEEENGKLNPMIINQKPTSWFKFDDENQLKIVDGSKSANDIEPIPDFKFLLTQNNPTFNNPYGEKILKNCYWPVKIKQSTIESWVSLIDKFGVPYLIGVVSDTATTTQKQEVIDALTEMIDSNIITRGVSEQIEIKEQASYDIGQLFEKMSEFQNKEISKAVLSVTLTVDVGRSGSFRTADIHKTMLEYIGISDKKLVEETFNNMFQYYTELNYGLDVPQITVKLITKERITEESAKRDETLTKIGVKFNKDYFKKKYNLAEEDFELVDEKE